MSPNTECFLLIEWNVFALPVLSAYKQIYDKKKQIKVASIDIFLIRVTSPHEEPQKKALLS